LKFIKVLSGEESQVNT